MEKIKRIDKFTILRTLFLLIAISNQFLVIVGRSPLPIEDTTIELLFSTLWTTVTAFWSWWKNNSFTNNAIEAQEVLNYLNRTNNEVNQENTQV